MKWTPDEDIACAHAILSLEEVRNRRAVVKQGDHVEYDHNGRNSRRVDSESSPIGVGKKAPAGNFGISQRMGAFKNQVSVVAVQVLKYTENSVRYRGNIGSCFKPRVTSEVQSSELSDVEVSAIPPVMSKSPRPEYRNRTLVVPKLVGNDISEITVEAESQDSLRTVSIYDEESSPIPNGKERVKSQLPSEEPVPYVESGFVKRAIRSYTLNVVKAGRDSDSIDEERDSVVNASGETTGSTISKPMQYSFSELADHSMVSSGSDSPTSGIGMKDIDPEGHYQAKEKRSSDFQNGYVARIAESFDYYIGHEQSGRRPGLQ